MFVIVTYDIDIESGAKRLRKVSKVCECYGYRVQKSVFEMNIDSAQLTHLINELIYKCGKTMKGKTVILGKRQKIEVADDSAFFL